MFLPVDAPYPQRAVDVIKQLCRSWAEEENSRGEVGMGRERQGAVSRSPSASSMLVGVKSFKGGSGASNDHEVSPLRCHAAKIQDSSRAVQPERGLRANFARLKVRRCRPLLILASEEAGWTRLVRSGVTVTVEREIAAATSVGSVLGSRR